MNSQKGLNIKSQDILDKLKSNTSLTGKVHQQYEDESTGTDPWSFYKRDKIKQ